MKQLRSDAIQVSKTPVYIMETDNGQRYFIIDEISFDELRDHLEEQ